MTHSRKPKTMIVAGVMSGTSADGVDVALVEIAPARQGGSRPRVKLLAHRSFAYPKAVRAAVLAAMDAASISVAELARLNWRLGEVYADAIAKTCAETCIEPELIGLHGQTIYHQATPARYLKQWTSATWQIGEAAVIGARMRVPVVSDFRPADLAAGGQGAPLVPMLDLCLFASARSNRILLNLGGIANLTAIPAGAAAGDVLAFDIGPANMVMDALMSSLLGKSFDRGGKVAARGRVLTHVVEQCLRDAWFSQAPPKSCGREQFGHAYVERFSALCGEASSADQIATACELTSASIVHAYQLFVRPYLETRAPASRRTELIVAGGGARNLWLMQRLCDGFASFGVEVKTAEEAGMPAQAKEAMAFALLAWLRWHGLPGNVPAATGARADAVLGAVSLW